MKPSIALLLAACVFAGAAPAGAANPGGAATPGDAAAAQGAGSGIAQTPVPQCADISDYLPPVRGIDMAELPSGIPDKGPISLERRFEIEIGLIAEALSWLGTPYSPGGFTRSGTDCSGFVNSVLRITAPEYGPYPRRSDGFARVGAKVDEIQPGDILLFSREGSIYHVGIALDEACFIHSASEGARTGVIITWLREGHWRERFCGARRIIP